MRKPPPTSNLAVALERAGLSQVALAKRLGVSESTVSCWKSRRKSPSAGLLVRLAKELRLTADEAARLVRL